MMYALKISALASLLFSSFLYSLVLYHGENVQEKIGDVVYELLIVGNLNLLLQGIYCWIRGVPHTLFMLLLLSGLVWLFPAFLFSFFGIPLVLLHLALAFMVHLKMIPASLS